MENQFLLAGDIGGTKTILALFSHEKGPLHPVFEASYSSHSYPGLDPIIKDFCAQTGTFPSTACFGVAGPVRGTRAIITNLPWQPDTEMLQVSHGFAQATLLNDLVATGYAIPHLSQQSDLLIINEGLQDAEGAIGIIAPGTGLGEAIFTWDGSRYLAVPSEGGHSDFAPTSDLEYDLFRFAATRYGHVSYDRICSGRGIPLIYDFLKNHSETEEPDWLAEQLACADDRAPVIVNAALATTRTCEICSSTLHLFVSVLAAEAGNLALKGLTTGGMYLGGGIPPRILPLIRKDSFMTSFAGKGRMSYLMADIPVKIILNPNAALIGAASFGLGLTFTGG
jgi:glucokinase